MGTPPIAYAVMGGDFDLVKSRVEAGGDINEVTDKGTALHVACIYKRLEIGRYLLEQGADPHSKDRFGQSPLDIVDDAEMVALLRQFGAKEFGLYDSNSLVRNGQKNALLLGNKHDVELFSELEDPLDNYLGLSVPWLSLAHLHSIEEAFDIAKTPADSAIVTQEDGSPQLHILGNKLMRSVDLPDEALLDKATLIGNSRPFKKMSQWDKYSIFVLLCSIRALNFVSKKRKLKLYYQQWDSLEK